MACLFCAMNQGTIPTDKIYEDEHLFVIRDIQAKAEVHLLVIPKIHLENLQQAESEHAALLGYIMISLKKIAATQGLNDFRTVINTGKESGQSIFHLHFHLLGGANLPTF